MKILYVSDYGNATGLNKLRTKTFSNVRELLDFICYYSIRTWSFVR